MVSSLVSNHNFLVINVHFDFCECMHDTSSDCFALLVFHRLLMKHPYLNEWNAVYKFYRLSLLQITINLNYGRYEILYLVIKEKLENKI